jgi:hypothetical protein
MPKRIQRKRTKGSKMPTGAVYVGRHTRFGNPFPVKWYGRELAVRLYAMWIDSLPLPGTTGYWVRDLTPPTYDEIETLRGLDLACWCPLDGRPCHAELLLSIANWEVTAR